MPAPTHRTIDASVFLEVYLQGTHADACEEFLNLDVSSDTILSDLTIGEVILNLKVTQDIELAEQALPNFLARVDSYRLVPLAPDCFDLIRTEDFKELRGVQDKDRLVLAYAISNGLTQLRTLDRGLLDEQAAVNSICEERGVEPLRIEWPRSARKGRR